MEIIPYTHLMESGIEDKFSSIAFLLALLAYAHFGSPRSFHSSLTTFIYCLLLSALEECLEYAFIFKIQLVGSIHSAVHCHMEVLNSIVAVFKFSFSLS